MTSQRFHRIFFIAWQRAPSVGSSGLRTNERKKERGKSLFSFFEGFITVQCLMGLKHLTVNVTTKVWDNLKNRKMPCLDFHCKKTLKAYNSWSHGSARARSQCTSSPQDRGGYLLGWSFGVSCLKRSGELSSLCRFLLHKMAKEPSVM